MNPRMEGSVELRSLIRVEQIPSGEVSCSVGSGRRKDGEITDWLLFCGEECRSWISDSATVQETPCGVLGRDVTATNRVMPALFSACLDIRWCFLNFQASFSVTHKMVLMNCLSDILAIFVRIK